MKKDRTIINTVLLVIAIILLLLNMTDMVKDATAFEAESEYTEEDDINGTYYGY